MGKLISIRNCSISLFKPAPPMISSLILPPKACMTKSLTRSFTLWLMRGMFIRSLMRLVSIVGNIFLRIIFSTTKGTLETSFGFRSCSVSDTSVGLGSRVKKLMCTPRQNPNRKSIMRPYMWAMGRKESILSPGSVNFPNVSRAHCRLLVNDL